MTASRREFLTLSGAALGALATGYPTAAIAQAPVNEVMCIGGTGGRKFGPIYPTSVGLAQGRDSDNAVRVNYIEINGVEYGSRNVDEGRLEERNTLRLGPDEYITAGIIRWDHRHPIYGKNRPTLIDRLDLRTNLGNRTWTPGWSEFSKEVSFDSARVCTISGRVGSRLDQVCFELIRNYQPSQLVEENEPAVFEVHAPGTTYFEAETVVEKRISTWERVVSRQRTRSFSASVGVELLAGLVNANTGVSVTNQVTTVETVADTLEQTRTNVRTIERKAEEFYGIVTGRVNVYLDQEGNYYATPTTNGRFDRYDSATLPLVNRYLNFANDIDLAPIGIRTVGDPLYDGDLERILIS